MLAQQAQRRGFNVMRCETGLVDLLFLSGVLNIPTATNGRGEQRTVSWLGLSTVRQFDLPVRNHQRPHFHLALV